MAFEFPVTVPSLEEVPEGFRGLYVQTNKDDAAGGFSFHEDFSVHTNGLRKALDTERGSVRTSTEAMRNWKVLGETPKAVQEKIDTLQKQVTEGKDGSVDWNKLKGDLNTAHGKAIEAKDVELSQMLKSLSSHLIDGEATRAITEAKGSVNLLLPHIKSATKVIKSPEGHYVVQVVDAAGDPRGNTVGGFMNIKDLVSEMRTQEDFLRAFDPIKTTGSGTLPAGRPTHTGTETKTVELSPTQKIQAGLRARQQAGR